jgi:hypothetical protein
VTIDIAVSVNSGVIGKIALAGEEMAAVMRARSHSSHQQSVWPKRQIVSITTSPGNIK